MSALTLVPTTKKRTSVEEPDECPLFDLRLEKRPRKGSPSSPTKRDRTREKDRSRDRSGSKSGRHKDREKKDRERAKEQEAAAALVQHSFLSSPSEVKAESGVVVSSSTSNSLKSSGKHSKSSSLRSSGGRGGSGGTPPPAVILSNLGNYPPRPPSATVARSIAPALASAPSSPAHIRDDSSPPAARPPTPNATTPSPPTGQPSSQTSSASAHQKLPAIASLLEYADMASKKQKHRDAKAAAVQKSTSADLLSSSSSPSLLSSSSGLPSVVVALSSSSSSLSASSSPSPSSSSSSSSSSVPKSYSPSSSSSSSTTSSTSSSSSSPSSSPSPSSSSLSASSSSSSSSTSSSSSAPSTAGSFLSPSSPPRLPSQGKSSLVSSSLSSSPSPSALLSHSSPAVLTNIAGSAESLQQAAAASKTPRGPSSKDSSRLFGVVWMLRGVLPSTRPPFVTERQWQNLLTDTSIVTIIRFEAGTLTLRFPEEYDTVVHSRAIYGPTLTRYTEPIKTRFRWWSDCSVDQISPIKNLKISQTHVERKITLPKDITSHPFLRGLYKSPSEHPRLLWELSDFFEDLLHAFLHPKDIDALDTSGFGRSRKRLLTTCDDSSRAFDETLASNIARWDRVVDTNEPPRSRRDTVRFGFGERYPEPEDVVHNNNSSSSSSHGGVPTTSVTQSPTTTTTSPPSMMMTTMATPTRPHALAAYQQALSASAPMALLPTPPVYATTSTSRTPSPPSATPSFMQVHAKLSLAATPGRVAMPTSIVPMPASGTQGHFASTHAHMAYATMTAAGHLPIAPVPVHRVPIQPQAPGAPMSLYTACPPTTPAPSSLPISTSQSSTQSHTNSSPTASSSSPAFSLAARTSTVSIPTQLTQPLSPPVTGTPVSPSNPSNSVAPVVTATDDDIPESEQLTPTEARPIVAPSDSASLESPLNESEATSGQAESAAVSDDP